MAKHTTITPEWMGDFPACSAISIGCPNERGTSLPYGVRAHAHAESAPIGTICLTPTTARSDEWDDAYPSALFLHEYAHLLTKDADAGHAHSMHGPAWRANAERLWAEWGYSFPFQRRWKACEMPLHEDDREGRERAVVRERNGERERKEWRDREAAKRKAKQANCEHRWFVYSESYKGGALSATRFRCHTCNRTRRATKVELESRRAELRAKGYDA